MIKRYKILSNVTRALLVIAIGCMTSSCFGLLDEEPYTSYDADKYFVSLSNLDMGVLGVYESLSDQNTYGKNWMIFNTNTDELQISQGDPSSNQERATMTYFKILPTDNSIENAWTLYYQGIDRANLILKRGGEVPTKSDAEVAIKARYIAEARFLRGLYYFDLVRLYGPVPLKTKVSEYDDNFNIPRSSTDAIYDQIIADMSEAINDLPYYDQVGRISSRITKGAALGILARVYLFRGGYSLNQDGEMVRADNYRYYYRKAEECIALIDKDKHKLNPNFQNLFENYSKYIAEPQESMFEVEFFNPSGSKPHSGLWGTYCGVEVHQNSKFGRANSFIKTNKVFFNTFEDGDLRRDVSICRFKIDVNNLEAIISEKNNNTWTPGKWRRTWMSGTVKDLNNSDVNFCLIRYADVLLMNAEIKNELYGGPDDEAFECVNMVRRRAFGRPINTPSDIDLDKSEYGDKDKFFEYIYAERSRELCFELTRRLDLIRWNRLDGAIKKYKVDFEKWRIDWNAANPSNQLTTKLYYAADYFTVGKHELFPIPDRERRETGYVISQNNGY